MQDKRKSAVRKLLKNRKDDNDKNGGGGSGGPGWDWDGNKARYEEDQKNNMNEIVVDGLVVAGGIGGAYLIYRGIRFLPSLLPPLWGTIPINALAP